MNEQTKKAQIFFNFISFVFSTRYQSITYGNRRRLPRRAICERGDRERVWGNSPRKFRILDGSHTLLDLLNEILSIYSVIWSCTITLEIYVKYFNVSPAYRRPIAHFDDPMFLPSGRGVRPIPPTP